VQGEKISELRKEIKGLILKTNEPPLGLDANLSEQEAVTFKELPGNAANFQHCWTQEVNAPDEYLQLYWYLLFLSFYSSTPTKMPIPSAGCRANMQHEKRPLPPTLMIRPAQKNTRACHAWGAQRAWRRRGAGVRGRRSVSTLCCLSPRVSLLTLSV